MLLQDSSCCCGFCCDANTAGSASVIMMYCPATVLLLRVGLCPEHIRADAIRLKGGGDQLWRFCQQVRLSFLASCLRTTAVEQLKYTIHYIVQQRICEPIACVAAGAPCRRPHKVFLQSNEQLMQHR
jgi:hypothetical protein